MTIDKPSHLVVVPTAMWGHLRPLLHLSLNLLSIHTSLHLTLLISPSILPRVTSELASTSFAHIYTSSASSSAQGDVQHVSEEEKAKQDKAIINRLQIITCISKEFDMPKEYSPELMAKEAMDYAQTLPGFLKALISKEHALDDTVNRFEHLPPKFLIFDSFLYFLPDVMKGVIAELKKPMIPVIAFLPSNAAATFHTYASEENGGSYAKMLRLVEEDVAKGRNILEAYSEHTFATYGKIKEVPGLPTKFDYEWWPNVASVPVPPEASMSIIPAVKAVHDEIISGMICPTTAELEEVAVKALEKEMGLPIYMTGPQFPDSIWAGEYPERKANNADDERVFAFLDKMQSKYGSNSVIYVSLGSLFYPASRPELVKYILESLKESGFPFLFAYASQIAQVPEDLIRELTEGGNGCVVKFAPQWDVLNHDATGFFLSHCGSNSTAEAIMAELPMVSMPIAADQGEFTAWLSEIYKVSIDLKQIKTFSKPEFNKLYDGTIVHGTEEAIMQELKETWDTLRGEEGLEMRKRMKDLKAAVKKSWEGGRSRDDMLRLGRCFE